MDLEAAKNWIEGTAGRPVVDIVRLAAGASRAMYVVRMEKGADLILRIDPGTGMMAGTELTLAREAEVYRALAAEPVPIPGFVGVTDDGRSLLVERATGDFDLLQLPDNEREAVCGQFIDALADLHTLDTSRLHLPSFAIPRGPRDHALLELDLWERVFRARVRRPAPLAECAFAVLRELAPVHDGPPSLCHGDVGPKNFLFDRGGITALIDWEFAHIGDPMDDLAWWVFRGHEWLGAGGDLTEQLRRWSARTGREIAPDRIAYYRALVLLRWYVMILAALDNGTSAQDRLPYLSLIPVLDLKLSSALAGLQEIDLGTCPAPDEGEPLLSGEALATFRSDLGEIIEPALDDVEALRRAKAVRAYADHFEAVDRHGATTRAGDREDLHRLLGHDVAEISEGEAELAARGWSDGPSRQQLLTYFMRRGARHAHLWPLTKARALTPPWTTACLGLDAHPSPQDH